nr:hypothetical protein [uncultured Anaerobutyricum sp.]
MANWREYTTKSAVGDTDELMIADATANVNKRTPLSILWNWIVGKLTSAVIANLETNSKSVVGALNELNSKRLVSYEGVDSNKFVDLSEYILSLCKDGEIKFFSISSSIGQNKGAPDNNGGFAICYKSTSGERYGIVVVFSYSKSIYIKKKSIDWEEKWTEINSPLPI